MRKFLLPSSSVMAIENTREIMHVRAGRPDYNILKRLGKLPVPTRPDGDVFDPHPNPKQMIQGKLVSRGATLAADNIWRVNLSPEKYHEMVLQAQEAHDLNKDCDFLPELWPQEIKSYREWLAKNGLAAAQAIPSNKAHGISPQTKIKNFVPSESARTAAVAA